MSLPHPSPLTHPYSPPSRPFPVAPGGLSDLLPPPRRAAEGRQGELRETWGCGGAGRQGGGEAGRRGGRRLRRDPLQWDRRRRRRQRQRRQRRGRRGGRGESAPRAAPDSAGTLTGSPAGRVSLASRDGVLARGAPKFPGRGRARGAPKFWIRRLRAVREAPMHPVLRGLRAPSSVARVGKGTVRAAQSSSPRLAGGCEGVSEVPDLGRARRDPEILDLGMEGGRGSPKFKNRGGSEDPRSYGPGIGGGR